MRPPILRNAVLTLVSTLLLPVARAQPSEPLMQIATLPLPSVAGRIDHLAFDAQHQRLFVAALGNDTVEVLDAASNAHLKSLPGFHEPQGIAVASDFGAIAVANGDSGTLQLLDADTFATRWTVEVGGDADNVRCAAAAKLLYVAAEGGLYRVAPASGKVERRIAIDGHPESFQLEAAGKRLFANLPGVLSSQGRSRRPRLDRSSRDGRRSAAAPTIRWRLTSRRRGCSSAAARRRVWPCSIALPEIWRLPQISWGMPTIFFSTRHVSVSM